MKTIKADKKSTDKIKETVNQYCYRKIDEKLFEDVIHDLRDLTTIEEQQEFLIRFILLCAFRRS